MAKKKQTADVSVADAVEVVEDVTAMPEPEVNATECGLNLAEELAALREIAPSVLPKFDVVRALAARLNGDHLAANAERIAEYGTNAESVQCFKHSLSVVLTTLDEAAVALDRVSDSISKVS